MSSAARGSKSGLLLGEIAVAGEPELGGEPVDAGQKPLQAVEVLKAFPLDQCRAVFLPGVVPALRDCGCIGGAVLALDQGEPRLGDQALVLSWRNEQVESDRAPNGQL